MSIDPSTRKQKRTVSAGIHSAGLRRSADTDRTEAAPSAAGSGDARRRFHAAVASRATPGRREAHTVIDTDGPSNSPAAAAPVTPPSA